MRRIVLVPILVVVLVGACTTSPESTTTTTTSPPVTSTTLGPPTTVPATTVATTTTAAPGYLPLPPTGFGATLLDVPLITEGTYPGPSWPTSLNDVTFAEDVPERLRSALVANGFAIEPNVQAFDEEYGLEQLGMESQFSAIYERLSPYGSGERAVFVTTDAAYHHWHLAFDKVLRDTEERGLLPILEDLVVDLVAASREEAASVAGTGIVEGMRRAEDHLSAVAAVLGLDVGPLSDLAIAEVALVEEHAAMTYPPTVVGEIVESCEGELWAAPSCVDYTLMKPRGHYTRTEDLTRYFKAMSMLGNTGFSLTDAEVLRVGLLIAQLIVSDSDRAAAWATIYDPTAFLVGSADDYTPFEAASAAASVLPEGLANASLLADDNTVLAIGAAMQEARPVLIDPGRASLRTMGARFVLDSWTYDQLTAPFVTGRLRPSPLDFASVLGSTTAAGIQDEAGDPATYPEYAPKVAELEAATAVRTIDDWGRTVYDAWLYAIEPQWANQHDEAFPPFMRNTAWKTKALATGFGSYAELKHDTILYAKQAMAEGEGPEPKPTLHWVEPDPVTFGRLAAVTAMLRDGLIGAGLMLEGDYDAEDGDPFDEDEATRWLADTLIDMFQRFERIARDELAAQPISQDDNAWLANIGSAFGVVRDHTGYEYGFDPSPLIADIFLDGGDDPFLEVATGPPDLIYVLVPDDRGGFQVATGAVYAYYEFWNAERLSDEEWWDRIVAGDLPDRPSWWTDEFD